jgi:hypothetical protein
VFIDAGTIAGQVGEVFPGGVDKVLEFIGTTTLADSLRCVRQRGIVCMTGMVGNKWSFDEFAPMDVIPSSVCLTTYDGRSEDFMLTRLDQLVEQIYGGPVARSGRPDLPARRHRRSASLYGREPGGRQNHRPDLISDPTRENPWRQTEVAASIGPRHVTPKEGDRHDSVLLDNAARPAR